jgi:prevent-host-death family protein
MTTVGAREANRSFSKILREAESGKTVTITRNGRPVARLVPAPVVVPAAVESMTEEERNKAHKELMDLLEKGFDLGGRGFTRDEMHER